MSKHIQHVLLFVTDFVSIQLAFYSWAWVRRSVGHFVEPDPQQFFINSCIIFAFWFMGFVFWGLYHSWHAQSRIDEVISILKVVTIGILFIFLLTFDLATDVEEPLPASRALVMSYWFLMFSSVSVGRMLLRTFQRTLLESGIGERKALIVGWGEKAHMLFDEVRHFPAQGYSLIGFIDPNDPPAKDSYRGCPVVGSLQDLAQVIEQHEIDEVLIAMDEHHHEMLMDILFLCSSQKVRIKITPSLYDIAAGQVHTHQIYGLPLIDVLSDPMPSWQYSIKRLVDIMVAATVLVLSAPVWLAMLFRLHKKHGRFGWHRIARVGRGFRRFELFSRHKDDIGSTFAFRDVLPQFFNVLRGDLSLVGPRPERADFAETLQTEVKLYHRRGAVRPGLIGWAQLKGDGGHSLEKIKRTLQYDFFYIENMSLRMDLKILLVAAYAKLFGQKARSGSGVA